MTTAELQKKYQWYGAKPKRTALLRHHGKQKQQFDSADWEMKKRLQNASGSSGDYLDALKKMDLRVGREAVDTWIVEYKKALTIDTSTKFDPSSIFESLLAKSTPAAAKIAAIELCDRFESNELPIPRETTGDSAKILIRLGYDRKLFDEKIIPDTIALFRTAVKQALERNYARRS
jgi:cAMP-regulated phosphoprotein/endosulfine conserved region